MHDARNYAHIANFVLQCLCITCTLMMPVMFVNNMYMNDACNVFVSGIDHDVQISI